MTLREWTPFPYLDTDWRFEFPRHVREEVVFRPSVDVEVVDGDLLVTAELPGMKAEDVDVSLDADILTISGEKREEREVDEDNRYMRERIFGTFERKIALPEGVTPDSVNAMFENGVLTVRVQLPEDRTDEPRRIPVSTR